MGAVSRAKGRGQRAKVWNELTLAILLFLLPSALSFALCPLPFALDEVPQ
jgi:hypothetical protein